MNEAWTDFTLPPELVRGVDQRFRRLPALSLPLDRWDFCTSIAAGVAGAIVDLLVGANGGILKDVRSAVTQKLSVDSDNWLGRYTKVAFDRVAPGTYAGSPLPGVNPHGHRLHTVGHDPLLGFVFGVFDIASGTMSGVDATGAVFMRPVPGAPEHSWAAAPLVWVGHLLSDMFTKQGLPVPGWIATQLMPERIAELARSMYRRGYDLRTYLRGALSVGTVEVVTRAYVALRYGGVDVQSSSSSLWSEREQAHLATSLEDSFQAGRVGHHEARLLLTAHTIAAGANAIRFAATENPLTIDLMQWQAWALSLARIAGSRIARREPRDLERIVRNRAELDTGWLDLLENEDDALALRVSRTLALEEFTKVES